MDETSLSVYPAVISKSPSISSQPVHNISIDSQKPGSYLFELPERLNEVPDWLRTPFRRFLRLRRRNWPLKTVRIYT